MNTSLIKAIKLPKHIYWRFIGDKYYQSGFPHNLRNGLLRIGKWDKDKQGIVVDPFEIKIWLDTQIKTAGNEDYML